VNRQCPKCSFEKVDADFSPTEACPKCGVIYAKVATATAPKPRAAPIPPPVTSVTPKRREVRIPLGYLLVCVTSLLLGYFVGREHMRYQLVTAMSTAVADSLGNAAKTMVPASPSSGQSGVPVSERPPPTATKETELAPIEASLVAKGFRDKDFSGGHYVTPAVTFTVRFDNKTGKDIRAFDGVLAFNDLLGNRVLASRLTISDPIGAGQSHDWQGEMEYNQFMSDHTKLRGYQQSDVKVDVAVHKVLFADGSEKVYDGR